MIDLLLNPFALLLDTRMGVHGIEFVLLRCLVIATIRYDNIAKVEVRPNLLRQVTAYRCVNRWVATRFMIYKRTAWFSKYVVLSPANEVHFKESLRARGVLVLD